jgi:hypothetical protein
MQRCRDIALAHGWIRSVERPGYKYLASAFGPGRYVGTWEEACLYSGLLTDLVVQNHGPILIVRPETDAGADRADRSG